MANAHSAAPYAFPTPLPPPLQRSDGGFTEDTLLRRLPAILTETCRASHAPPALALAVAERLCAPLAAGALLPPPPVDAEGLWAAATPAAPNSSPASFWWQENVAYRHLLALWEEHGLWPAQDPFANQKRESLASAAAAFVAGMGASSAGGAAPPLGAALLRSLWGNRADLSLSAGRVDAACAGSAPAAAAGDSLLLANDAPAALAHLEAAAAAAAAAAQPLRLSIVLDNCGLELLQDLRLVDALLAAWPCARLTLHAKRWPTFVSDALECDVRQHIEWLTAHVGCAEAGALGTRLQAALASGRLALTSHAFWNCARPLWGMPQDLTAQLKGCALCIFKGDANYRRLLGDLHWPHAMGFGQLVGAYAPCPVLALRTCKCGLGVGIAAGEEARAQQHNPSDWLTSGKYGLVQFALPLGREGV